MREIEIGILIDVDVVEAEKKMYVNCVSGWFKNLLIIRYINKYRRKEDPMGKVGLLLEVKGGTVNQIRDLAQHQNPLTKKNRPRSLKQMLQQVPNLLLLL